MSEQMETVAVISHTWQSFNLAEQTGCQRLIYCNQRRISADRELCKCKGKPVYLNLQKCMDMNSIVSQKTSKRLATKNTKPARSTVHTVYSTVHCTVPVMSFVLYRTAYLPKSVESKTLYIHNMVRVCTTDPWSTPRVHACTMRHARTQKASSTSI